ncbi:MAG TPA: hypothetical protein VG819_06790 [Rhizomicrobium sp.]|jgi:hypothetical protein|nr:hypothetical protein [Rhizomicrobium sp.]
METKKIEREKRLAAALRENLRRRKAKTRGETRAAAPDAATAPESPRSADRNGD